LARVDIDVVQYASPRITPSISFDWKHFAFSFIDGQTQQTIHPTKIYLNGSQLKQQLAATFDKIIKCNLLKLNFV